MKRARLPSKLQVTALVLVLMMGASGCQSFSDVFSQSNEAPAASSTAWSEYDGAMLGALVYVGDEFHPASEIDALLPSLDDTGTSVLSEYIYPCHPLIGPQHEERRIQAEKITDQLSYSSGYEGNHGFTWNKSPPVYFGISWKCPVAKNGDLEPSSEGTALGPIRLSGRCLGGARPGTAEPGTSRESNVWEYDPEAGVCKTRDGREVQCFCNVLNFAQRSRRSGLAGGVATDETARDALEVVVLGATSNGQVETFATSECSGDYSVYRVKGPESLTEAGAVTLMADRTEPRTSGPDTFVWSDRNGQLWFGDRDVPDGGVAMGRVRVDELGDLRVKVGDLGECKLDQLTIPTLTQWVEKAKGVLGGVVGRERFPLPPDGLSELQDCTGQLTEVQIAFKYPDDKRRTDIGLAEKVDCPYTRLRAEVDLAARQRETGEASPVAASGTPGNGGGTTTVEPPGPGQSIKGNVQIQLWTLWTRRPNGRPVVYFRYVKQNAANDDDYSRPQNNKIAAAACVPARDGRLCVFDNRNGVLPTLPTRKVELAIGWDDQPPTAHFADQQVFQAGGILKDRVLVAGPKRGDPVSPTAAPNEQAVDYTVLKGLLSVTVAP
jgi:hypothetical protein